MSNTSKKVSAVLFLVFAIAYLVLPIDLIPDALVGLGQVDDAIVFFLSVANMAKTFKPNKPNEAIPQK